MGSRPRPTGPTKGGLGTPYVKGGGLGAYAGKGSGARKFGRRAARKGGGK